MGTPTDAYPWRWSINRWIEGENAVIERIDDLSQFASDLANFLNALHKIDTKDAPPPGPDNFFRGGALSVYHSETCDCIKELRDIVDARAATAIWESALQTRMVRFTCLGSWGYRGGKLVAKTGQAMRRD